MDLNVGIVLKKSLNVVWCWPFLIVVSVVERCSAPEVSKIACLGQKIARTAHRGEKIPKENPYKSSSLEFVSLSERGWLVRV